MNSIFTEENLLAFTTAARFNSFSKAAAELGVTTSAISYTIKRMETGLDVVRQTSTSCRLRCNRTAWASLRKGCRSRRLTTPCGSTARST